MNADFEKLNQIFQAISKKNRMNEVTSTSSLGKKSIPIFKSTKKRRELFKKNKTKRNKFLLFLPKKNKKI